MKRRILLCFGTRPEAIKMIPLYKKLKEYDSLFETAICVTAQHRRMLDQVLEFFGVIPEYDLDLMRPNQNLHDLTARIISGCREVLNSYKPHLVLVHGDTTTSMATALAGFYSGCLVGHVEAGLRTQNKRAPFPEEMNRCITGRLADLHFAPTAGARQNLIRENVPEGSIFVTGNTVIDALIMGKLKIEESGAMYASIEALRARIDPNRRMILVTGHRRESFGDGFVSICEAIKEIASTHPVQVVYPVHSNPNVTSVVNRVLGATPNILLIEPQPYEAFLWLMKQAFLILTDSGGVQEEAPSLGKPVLVMRDITERPEAVEAGTVILVGTSRKAIFDNVSKLLTDRSMYDQMSRSHNPYGDGKACERIVAAVSRHLVNS